MFRYRLPFYFPRGLFDAEKTRHFLPPFDVGRASLYLARHAGPITEPERRHQYLAACGATAITVIDRDGAGVVIVGKTAKGIVAGLVDRISGRAARGQRGSPVRWRQSRRINGPPPRHTTYQSWAAAPSASCT